jgi:hypothetical protein
MSELLGNAPLPPLPEEITSYQKDWAERTKKKYVFKSTQSKPDIQAAINTAEEEYRWKQLKERTKDHHRMKFHLGSREADSYGCAGFLYDLDGWTEDHFRTFHHDGDDPWLTFRTSVLSHLAGPMTTDQHGSYTCLGCMNDIKNDYFGDHTLNCSKGKGGTLATYRTIRHDKIAGITANLARKAGLHEVIQEKKWPDCSSQKRPGDLFVSREVAARQQEEAADIIVRGGDNGSGCASRRHNRDTTFEDTYFDVTVTTTHSKLRSQTGQPNADGDRARDAYKLKKSKYH